jgi:hypothetical protein
MVVFELPSKRAGGGTRAALFGSCRLRHPVARLHDTGHLRICNWGLKEVHNISEVKQSLDFIMGRQQIPDALSPCVFELNHTPDVDHLKKSLEMGVDLFIAEISAAREIVYRDILFQQNFFVNSFIRPHGETLLPWFRSLSRGLEPGEGEIAALLDRLKAGGFEHGAAVEDILRHTRFIRADARRIAQTLSYLLSETDRPWIVIGAITIADAPGALMRDRRALNDHLREIAAERGVLFYDPSDLVSEYGREAILDANGANVYELAPSVYPFVGQEMLKLIRRATGEGDLSLAPVTKSTPQSSAPPANMVAAARADRVNAELVTLHRARLRDMGSVDSGLYTHYERLADQEAIVGAKDRAAMALLETHLPDYPIYGVLRAGLGELAFLIAASGRRVLAYEPNARRRAAIEAGLDHLQTVGLIEPGTMTVVDSLSPATPFADSALGVALDASEVRDDAAAAPHLARMTQFSALLIDPRLFIRLRDTVAEQDRVLRDLGELGFNRRRDYFGDRLVLLERDARGS